MISIDNWLAFSLATVILLAIPGPTVLAVIGHSIAHGKGASRSLVAAVFLGDSTSAALSITGLGLLLQGVGLGLEVLQAAGGLYLVYMGIGLLRAPMTDSLPTMPIEPNTLRNVFGSTYLVTALNPKGFVFFSAFLPMFVEPELPVVPQLWILAVTFVALATLSAALFVELASRAHAIFGSAERFALVRRSAGGLLVLIGIFAVAGL